MLSWVFFDIHLLLAERPVWCFAGAFLEIFGEIQNVRGDHSDFFDDHLFTDLVQKPSELFGVHIENEAVSFMRWQGFDPTPAISSFLCARLPQKMRVDCDTSSMLGSLSAVFWVYVAAVALKFVGCVEYIFCRTTNLLVELQIHLLLGHGFLAHLQRLGPRRRSREMAMVVSLLLSSAWSLLSLVAVSFAVSDRCVSFECSTVNSILIVCTSLPKESPLNMKVVD